MVLETILVLAVVAAVIWFLIQQPFASGPDPSKFAHQSRIIKTKQIKEGDVHRANDCDELLAEPFPGVKTLYDIFQRGVRENPKGACLGHREGSGPFIWESYEKVNERVSNFASGLVGRGAKKGTLIAIHSVNCPEWVISAEACNAQSLVTVPLYDTLGQDACLHILNQTSVEHVVVGAKQFSVLQQLLPQCPSIKHIIYIGSKLPPPDSVPLGVDLVLFSDVEDEGREKPVAHNPPEAEDLACVCYTSGTTGNPKGAMISHRNLTADVAGVRHRMHELALGSTDVHLSYLPLAHMFERMIQEMVFVVGASIGFYRGDATKIFEDINTLRPTVFVSVPRLYTRLYDRIMDATKKQGFLRQTLFNLALHAKKANLKRNITRHWLWDWLVFSQLRTLIGGRVRLMVTGAAPLSEDVMAFLRCCFSCTVMEGYGQTECGTAACASMPGDCSLGNVGGPLPCVEIKLVDVEDMMYFSSDIPRPRGEVCFRGPVVFGGYYKGEAENPIDKDGWLHSGDIGQWNENGTLSIIDRRKNIFKLAQGEYVAPERVESVYLASPFIAQVFVHGNSLEASLVAIVVPKEDYSLNFAKTSGIAVNNLADLCNDLSFKEAVMFDMKTQAARQGLKGFETCVDIHLTTHEFTPENGILTPTYKLKRAVAQKVFQREIAAMYGKSKRG